MAHLAADLARLLAVRALRDAVPRGAAAVALGGFGAVAHKVANLAAVLARLALGAALAPLAAALTAAEGGATLLLCLAALFPQVARLAADLAGLVAVVALGDAVLRGAAAVALRLLGAILRKVSGPAAVVAHLVGGGGTALCFVHCLAALALEMPGLAAESFF